MLEGRRVLSGLRPKKRGERSSNRNEPTQVHQVVKPTVPICNNPLERLAGKLSSWRLVDNLIKDQPSKDFDVIPDRFEDFSAYLTAWEPLLLEELKANILSNVSALRDTTSNAGPVNVVQLDMDGKSSLVRLYCNVDNTIVGSRRCLENTTLYFPMSLLYLAFVCPLD